MGEIAYIAITLLFATAGGALVKLLYLRHHRTSFECPHCAEIHASQKTSFVFTR